MNAWKNGWMWHIPFYLLTSYRLATSWRVTYCGRAKLYSVFLQCYMENEIFRTILYSVFHTKPYFQTMMMTWCLVILLFLSSHTPILNINHAEKLAVILNQMWVSIKAGQASENAEAEVYGRPIPKPHTQPGCKKTLALSCRIQPLLF